MVPFQDESYKGYCNRCDISIEWEPNYDDYDDVLRIDDNNFIIVGDRETMGFDKGDYPYSKHNTTEEEYQRIISRCERFTVDCGDKRWEAKIGGRKGRKCWNNKRRELAKYIQSHLIVNTIDHIDSRAA